MRTAAGKANGARPVVKWRSTSRWISATWETSENNRRAKYYQLTARGRKALGDETEQWRRYVGVVEQILVDPDEHNDWSLRVAVDLDRSDAEERPVLVLAGVEAIA